MRLPPMIPQKSGRIANQAHVDIPSGTYEEEHGRSGFYGQVSHLYHKNPPTSWSRIEGKLLPHLYDLNRVASAATEKPQDILQNADVRIGIFTPLKPMPYYARNADGDEVWFIHSGAGKLETEYGEFEYRRGDYLVLPRGTTYRFFPDQGVKTGNFYLRIESSSAVQIPDRGQLGRNAFYDPGVIELPKAKVSQTPATVLDGKNHEWEVVVKREGEFTSVFYPFNPLDVEGWKGDLFPWRLNVADIRPIVSPKFHLPPSVHSTLLGKGFVLCTFAPRPMETGDPKAQRVPFYHRNIDYDEVIFYHDGDFFSRTNIKPGMMTFHPQGIHHGPHPKALENQFKKEFTDELAVMIDTEKPLRQATLAANADIPEYRNSWKTK